VFVCFAFLSVYHGQDTERGVALGVGAVSISCRV